MMKSKLVFLLLAVSLQLSAQYYADNPDYNPILTAAGYLLLPPDARSVGAGESGVASSADVFSLHWNPAKYAFAEDKFGIAAAFSGYPWMKEFWLFGNDIGWDIGFNALYAYLKINDNSAAATSLTYYNPFGEIVYTDEFGNDMGVYKPFDIHFDLAYSYRISEVFSTALAARYIYSGRETTQYVQASEKFNGNSVAFDLAVFYSKPLALGSRDGNLCWGVNLSNIGLKMKEIAFVENKQFIPTNLRLGAAYSLQFDDDHALSCQLDANKLLVPTPPEYLRDSIGFPVYDEDGDPVIARGMDPHVSVLQGMVQSWYDAPRGFQEEMQEWSVGGGFEYRYKSEFWASTGLFYQHKNKGSWRYYTLGAGFKLGGVFGLDLGLKLPLDRKLKEDYFAIFYLRTSVIITVR